MPNWKQLVRQRLAVLRLPPERELEIIEELALHLEAAYEDALADGWPAAEAEAQAVQSYDWRLLECELSRAEQPFAARWLPPAENFIDPPKGIRMESLWQDARFAWRMLLKRPGFSLLALLMLALGIGANTAIFSVVQAVLLRPLPFAEQERLIVAWKKDTVAYNPFVEMAVAEFKDWQAQSQSFERLAVMPTTVYGYGYVLTGQGEAVQLESAKVTGGFFAALGVQAARGRVFDERDDVPNGPRVAVLSDRLWRERFNADPNIVGQQISLTQRSFTVLGVLPPQFEFPKGVDLWTPLQATMGQRALENRAAGFLQVIGKLKPGVSLTQAEAELNTIIARVAAAHPETNATGQRAVIKPLAEFLFGNARPALWLLLAATGLLLLLGAANVTHLLLAQASARRREFAVRAALGARRGQLVRQLLCESAVLALAGGALGVGLAYGLIDVLVWLAPADIPRIESVKLNGPVLLFSLGVTLFTALLAGLAPALLAARVNLNEVLSEGSTKLASGRAGRRWRAGLVVAELAVTLVLAVGATLILRSFLNLSRVNLGFDPHNVLTMQLRLQGPRYNSAEAHRTFYQQLVERLEAQPGVVAATAILTRPLEGSIGWEAHFALPGQTPEQVSGNTVANYEIVSPHYFTTLGIPLKAGRAFNEFDKTDAPPVVIISETMARRLFPAGVDPVGQRMQLDPRDPASPWRTIVGIAGDVRYRELEDVRWDIYAPHAQAGSFLNHFAVRTTGDPAALLATVRREIAALDPTQVATSVATLEQQVATNLARPRFNALLLNWLAALAVVLAAAGLYGVVAYSVAQRTGELGIRLALGAQTSDILKLIIGENLRLIALGVLGGLGGALALTRTLETLLYGVSATDWRSFAVVTILLVAVALLACWLPARRAAQVDPLTALRTE